MSEDHRDAQQVREGRVLAAVVSLVDSLLADFDVIELLTQLTERCVQLLDVASAGLLLADTRGRLQLMAATSGKTHALELAQLQGDDGPCLDCYATGEPVSVADLRGEMELWPRFVPAALATGFASVHAVPMRRAGTVLGALGLFGTTTGNLNAADLLVAQTLAHIATVAILQEAAPTAAAAIPHLRNALISRVVIEQAKGFLHEDLGVSVDEAFVLLRTYCRTRGLRLTDLSRQIMSDPAARSALLPEISEISRFDDALRRTPAPHSQT